MKYTALFSFCFCIANEAIASGFLWAPIEIPVISCDFCGYRYRENGRCHGGIDFGVQNYTDVFAAADGEVVVVATGWADNVRVLGTYGNRIEIKHDND